VSVIGLSLKKWRKTMSKQVLLDRRDFLRGGASVAMAAVLGSS
jgi:Tat pathway signal sequence domain protein